MSQKLKDVLALLGQWRSHHVEQIQYHTKQITEIDTTVSVIQNACSLIAPITPPTAKNDSRIDLEKIFPPKTSTVEDGLLLQPMFETLHKAHNTKGSPRGNQNRDDASPPANFGLINKLIEIAIQGNNQVNSAEIAKVWIDEPTYSYKSLKSAKATVTGTCCRRPDLFERTEFAGVFNLTAFAVDGYPHPAPVRGKRGKYTKTHQ